MLTLHPAGRPELIEEVESALPNLRAYIRDELAQLRAESYFDYPIDEATATTSSL